MKKNRTEYFLKHIGRLEEAELCDFADGEHVFSQKYELEKEKLLQSLEKRKKRNGKRGAVVAAAAAAAVLATSAGVYAAVSLFSVDVTEDTEHDKVNVQVKKEGETRVLPIKITANYLPEGYEEWEEGNYSLGGAWGEPGLRIDDTGWYTDWSQVMEYYYKDVSSSEIVQVGDAQGILVTHEGYDYPHMEMDLYYGDSGHVITVFASEDISREEFLKVCENLTYEERKGTVSEDGSIFTDENGNIYTLSPSDSAEEETEEEEVAPEALPVYDRVVMEKGETFNHPLLNDVKLKVTDIQIKDTVDTEKINEDTASDYAQVCEYLEGNTLKPYERYVEEWRDKELEKLPLDTVNVKNVEVTMEVTNTSQEAVEDINIYPVWARYSRQEDGTYLLDNSIPGYQQNENFRHASTYGIESDGAPYYFDGSSFPGTTHFYYMNMAAGETKTVHLWFAVPEDELENSYMVFDNSSAVSSMIKLK